jgi:hypothetical protein
MRTTSRLIIAFAAVFVAVAASIGVITWQLTSSVIGQATRNPRAPSSFLSSLGDSILVSVLGIVAVTVAGLAVFFFVMRRVMGSNQTLLATGMPGTALVLAVQDTGATINRVNAILDARLQVTLPGQAPYEANAEVILGRMSWGALQPGMTVAVKVDPKDPRRVAIDWAASRASAGPRAGAPGFGLGANAGAIGPGMVSAPGGSFPIPGVAGAMRAGAVRTATDVIAEGERAEGTIQTVSHTGATAGQMVPGVDAEKADDPMVYIAMQVQPRQGAAFAAQGIYRVPKRKLGVLAIGRRVPVAFLPGEPGSATIDWSRL